MSASCLLMPCHPSARGAAVEQEDPRPATSCLGDDAKARTRARSWPSRVPVIPFRGAWQLHRGEDPGDPLVWADVEDTSATSQKWPPSRRAVRQRPRLRSRSSVGRTPLGRRSVRDSHS